MGDKKLFQIIAQNTKQKVSTHLTEPHPGMQWHLYQAVHVVALTQHVKADTLAISEHFDHHRRVCLRQLQNNRNNYSNKYIIHSPTAVGFTEVFFFLF